MRFAEVDCRQRGRGIPQPSGGKGRDGFAFGHAACASRRFSAASAAGAFRSRPADASRNNRPRTAETSPLGPQLSHPILLFRSPPPPRRPFASQQQIRSRDTPVATAHERRKNRHSLSLPRLAPRHHRSGVTPYLSAASSSAQSARTSTCGGPNPRMNRSLSEVKTSYPLTTPDIGPPKHDVPGFAARGKAEDLAEILAPVPPAPPGSADEM